MSVLETELRRFLMALGYFTRLPIPAWVGYQPGELNRATRYFPLAGAVVGWLCALFFWVMSLVLPASLAVLLSMAFSLGLTGAFHEDGLADSADGLGGGWQKADVLRIMKDSRIGTFGASALLMALLIKFAALQHLSLQSPWPVVYALLWVHPLSRLTALCLMAFLPYVREDDSARAKPVAEGVGRVDVAWGAVLAVLPLLGLTGAGVYSLWMILGAGVLCLVILGLAIAYLRKRLGGYTGDCLGAVQQVSELSLYLLLCARWAS